MMANNVRCAGGGQWVQAVPFGVAVSGVVYSTASCGWKGRRFPRPLLAHRGVMIDTVKATAKPCPRCGGQVELTQQEPA